MEKTTASNVIEFFESSFADKHVIPETLEIVWLKKAIARFSLELDPLNFDDESLTFDTKLDSAIIATLASFMTEFYQERQTSLVNKRVSIVSKELSIDGSNGAKTAERAHLEYVSEKSREWIENQKPSALV